MQTLREWGFPVALIVAWMMAATYAVSLLIGPPEEATPIEPRTPAIADTAVPAS
jgi:hypothetical protein